MFFKVFLTLKKPAHKIKVVRVNWSVYMIRSISKCPVDIGAFGKMSLSNLEVVWRKVSGGTF